MRPRGNCGRRPSKLRASGGPLPAGGCTEILIATAALLCGVSAAHVDSHSMYPREAAVLDSLVRNTFGFDPWILIHEVEGTGVVFSVWFDAEYDGSDTCGEQMISAIISTGIAAEIGQIDTGVLSVVFARDRYMVVLETGSCIEYSQTFVDLSQQGHRDFIAENVVYSGYIEDDAQRYQLDSP